MISLVSAEPTHRLVYHAVLAFGDVAVQEGGYGPAQAPLALRIALTPLEIAPYRGLAVRLSAAYQIDQLRFSQAGNPDSAPQARPQSAGGRPVLLAQGALDQFLSGALEVGYTYLVCECGVVKWSMAFSRSMGSIVAHGRYRLIGVLGEGSFGEVYGAELLGPGGRRQRDVVLKVLRPQWSREVEVVARFEREFVAATRVEHQNVARMLEQGALEDGTPFLAMERLRGVSFRELMAHGPLGVARTAALLVPIATALSEVHRSGVVHRDIKPENLFLAAERDGQRDVPMLLDFGIARFLAESERITSMGAVIGTPTYMSPEQFRGDAELGPRADVYALAVTAYEMLSGAPPFPAKGFAALALAHVGQAAPVLTAVPAGLWQVLAACLEKDPAQRPTMAQLASALRAVWTTATEDLAAQQTVALRKYAPEELVLAAPRLVVAPPHAVAAGPKDAGPRPLAQDGHLPVLALGFFLLIVLVLSVALLQTLHR